MGQTELSGTIGSGQAMVTSGAFPSMSTSAVLGLATNPKNFQKSTGSVQASVATATGVYQSLSGIGSGQMVPEVDLLYLRSDAPVKVRVTQRIDTETVVSIHKVHGPFFMQTPPSDPITLVELSGSANIEYLAEK